jgi:glyoxylase-like metal-dependent hydrolase (beta-lactamase superfamily II)
LVYDENKQGIVFDCGFLTLAEKNAFKDFIVDNQIELVAVMNTHLHLDHQFGNKFLSEAFGLEPCAHKEDEFLLHGVRAQASMFGLPYNEDAQPIGSYIEDNQLFEFGDIRFKALHVPGHSPGSIAFYFYENNFAIVGDVLFKGSIGRTDLPKGDYATLIRSIQTRLLILPDNTLIYSGHGQVTSIGEEKQNNPYL